MLCPNCEAENRDDAKFCDECGFPLSGSLSRLGKGASPSGTGSTLHAQERQRLAESSYAAERPQVTHSQAIPTQASVDDFDAFDDSDDFDAFELRSEVNPYAETKIFEEEAQQRDSAASHQSSYSAETLAFDDSPQNDVFAQPVPQAFDNDPFAGYSRNIDEQEYGFQVQPITSGTPQQTPGSNAEWNTNYTMEMPRVNRGSQPKGRDFRIAKSEHEQGKKKLIALIAGGIIAGVAVAALVTYLLGFWGGIAVPNVVGMTENDARATLEQDGFKARSTQIKSDDTEGLVVVMDPSAGSRAGEGSEVVIHISTARFVPEVNGKTEEEAKTLLTDSGYENVRIQKVKSEDKEGVVLSVAPAAGTRAKSNAEIVVSVSEAYRVPDIKGLDLAAAEKAITDSGLTYGVAYVDTDQYEDGTILGTSPEQGTKVQKDSYVAVNVARKRGAELVALTESLFAKGQTVTIGGIDFDVQSLDSVSYEGDDVVAYTITGLPRTTFFGKTIYADETIVSGQIVYSEDNEVVAIY